MISLSAIRKSLFSRWISVLLILEILSNLCYPSVSYALTDGPRVPEIQNFQAVGMTEMVDLATGDFSYQIPIMDVGGYPVNLVYKAGVTGDQEASWVGLGWNLSAGSIERKLQAVPDDFKGDKIKMENSIRPDWTLALTPGAGVEIFGSDLGGALSFGGEAGISYNNYRGLELIHGLNIGFGSDKLGLGLGVSIDNVGSGVNVSPSLSIGKTKRGCNFDDVYNGANIGFSFNSQRGLTTVSYGIQRSVTANGEPTQSASLKGSFNTKDLTQRFPSMDFGLTTISHSGRGQFGYTAYGFQVMGDFSVRFSKTAVSPGYKERQIESYGLLHCGKAKETSIMDFNTDLKNPFIESTTNLPSSFIGQDHFVVSGHGVGGVFRTSRKEFGHVRQNSVKSTDIGDNHAVQISTGNVAGVGIDGEVNVVETSSGVWSVDNPAYSGLQYSTESSSDELAYFEMIGGLEADSDPSYFDEAGGYNAVSFRHQPISTWFVPLNSYMVAGNQQYNGGFVKKKRDGREVRRSTISYLTMSKVADFSIGRHEVPTDAHIKDHHIGEFTVLGDDGNRYVYGHPVYNTEQHEVTFNVSTKGDHPDVDCASGLVSYAMDGDDTVDNDKGIDHLYYSRSLPGYAYSWMITEVVSADYQDLTNDGPTDDDLGTYVEFSYTPHQSYNWRAPFGDDQHLGRANYDAGLLADFSDDKGHFQYGTKHITYLSSIETKTHKAEFFSSARADGIESAGRGGGLGQDSYKKLDKIVLKVKGPDGYRVVQEVFFQYEYLLCPGTPNTNPVANPTRAKLTLVGVKFRYPEANCDGSGNCDYSNSSNKSLYNNYNFSYNSPNPSYAFKGYDIWGTYNPIISGSGQYCFNVSPGDPLSNPEYPYTSRSKSSVDSYASSWCLTDIGLPSGAVIHVDYESDDYAFVQNKKALEMFLVVGMHRWDNVGSYGLEEQFPNSPEVSGDFLYDGVGISANKVFFRVDRAYGTEEFRQKFVAPILKENKGLVYFRYLVNIDDKSNGARFDYVPGYAELDGSMHGEANRNKMGTIKHNGNYYGYITLKDEAANDEITISPITIAAWNFTRLHLPRIAFDQTGDFPDPDEVGANFIDNMVEFLADASLIAGLAEFFTNPYKRMKNRGYASNYVPGKSWIRLASPNMKKLGGGHRVKRITMSDGWAQMKGGESWETHTSGIEYAYESHDDNGNVISSGVATNEPELSKENPLKEPKFYNVEQRRVPDEMHWVETPVPFSLFPAAGVTYSKVEIRVMDSFTKGGVDFSLASKNKSTGRRVVEHYTSKDYPTKTETTYLNPHRVFNEGLWNLVNCYNRDYVTGTQGYLVITNSMNGRLKAEWLYADGQDEPISGVEYIYAKENTPQSVSQADDPYSRDVYKPDQLNNECLVVYPNGEIEERTIGVDWAITNDFHETLITASSPGANNNLTTFLASIALIPVPLVVPSYSFSEQRLRTAVSTKLIEQEGILREIVRHDRGSRVSTKNLAWDSETGNVLISSTLNEFGDEIYSLRYPAYWHYDGMSGAYKNLMLDISGLSTSPSPYEFRVALSNPHNKLQAGDELIVTAANGVMVKGWVLGVGDDEFYLIDEQGDDMASLSQPFSIRVIRSGNRNLTSLPMLDIVLQDNPLTMDESGDYLNLFQAIESKTTYLNNGSLLAVLDSKAYEYSDIWQSPRTCYYDPNTSIRIDNPFRLNIFGNWRIASTYDYAGSEQGIRADRVVDHADGAGSIMVNGIRHSGAYENYSPFWRQGGPSGAWFKNNDQWRMLERVTLYDQNGHAREGMDAMSTFHAALYGYGGNYLVAKGINARHGQLGYDGFEDYGYDECTQKSFLVDLTAAGSGELSKDDSHTGSYSLELGVASSVFLGRPNQLDYISALSYNNVQHFNSGWLPNWNLNMLYFPSPSYPVVGEPYALESTTCLLSFWMKEVCDDYVYDNLAVSVNSGLTDNSIPPSTSVVDLLDVGSLRKGPIIDGWQKWYVTFTIDPPAPGYVWSWLKIQFNKIDDNTVVYIDDVRYHPVRSSMKSYVYDPRSLRMTAELDENNYATFYDYDEEGRLSRVRTETERGIYTVEESRNSLIKGN